MINIGVCAHTSTKIPSTEIYADTPLSTSISFHTTLLHDDCLCDDWGVVRQNICQYRVDNIRTNTISKL